MMASRPIILSRHGSATLPSDCGMRGLVERSYGIVRCLMDCHAKHSISEYDGEDKINILTECSDQGYRAASSEGPTLWQHGEASANASSKQEEIICELQAYLHDSFGHPVRIDYGTGHESSFVVFLLSLCKIGCFLWRCNDGDGKSPSNPPPPEVIGVASLSLFHAYLHVTRGLQRLHVRTSWISRVSGCIVCVVRF